MRTQHVLHSLFSSPIWLDSPYVIKVSLALLEVSAEDDFNGISLLELADKAKITTTDCTVAVQYLIYQNANYPINNLNRLKINLVDDVIFVENGEIILQELEKIAEKKARYNREKRYRKNKIVDDKRQHVDDKRQHVDDKRQQISKIHQKTNENHQQVSDSHVQTVIVDDKRQHVDEKRQQIKNENNLQNKKTRKGCLDPKDLKDLNLNQDQDLNQDLCENYEKNDLEKITEIPKSKKTKSKRFTKPTIKEIKSEIEKKDLQFSAERFYHHYESNGWRVGKNKMVSWKSAMQTWHRKNLEENHNGKIDTRSKHKILWDRLSENITDDIEKNGFTEFLD